MINTLELSTKRGELIKTVAASGTPERITSGSIADIAVTSITYATGVCTVTAAAVHGLTTGDQIVISGADQPAYNGTFVVTVTNTTVFTYVPLSIPSVATATGTIILPGMARIGGTDAALGTYKVLVTTPVAHGLKTGARVRISGAVQTEFNGAAQTPEAPGGALIQVVGRRRFVIMTATKASAIGTGTILYYADVWVRQAFIYGQNAVRTNNTGIVYLGENSVNDTQPIAIAAGALYTLTPPTPEARINLADIYVDAATNADGVQVIYD